MKSIIFFSFLLFNLFTCQGQNIFRYEISKYSYSFSDDSGEYDSWTDWDSVSQTMTFDKANNRIYIFNRHGYIDDYTVNLVYSNEKTTDATRDGYSSLIYEAVDKYEKECTIHWHNHDKQGFKILTIYYTDIAHMYIVLN